MSSLYTILGLPESATDEQIKQAYRSLAKRYHPDLHPGDAAMAKKFAEVNEAMETLGNPQKRKEYDSKRLAEKQQAEANAAAARAAAARQAAAAQAARASAASGRPYVGTAAGAQQVIGDAYRKGYNEGYAAGQIAGQNAANEARNSAAETWKKSADNWKKEAEKSHEEVDILKAALEKARQRAADAEAATRRMESSLRVQTAMNEEAKRAVAAEAAARESLRAQLESKIGVEREARKFSDADKVRLSREVTRLKEENEALKKRLGDWEAYGASEEETEELQAISEDWEEKLKAYKKQFKDTCYGVLGVYFWADDAEIRAAFAKKSKRLGKSDSADLQRKKLDDACKLLLNPTARREYDKMLGLTEADTADMRARREEYERALTRLEEKTHDEEIAAYIEEQTALAIEGDGEAALALGELYMDEADVPKDEKEAARWFTLGWENGNADAAYHLGLCYLNGEGVEPDADRGALLIKEAAEKGSEAAIAFTHDAETGANPG